MKSADVQTTDTKTHLIPALIGDGRPLLSLFAIGLILAGGFALFLSATGSFLPHDVAFLGMQMTELCKIGQCRIVHFMIHDRVSFGGVLIATGVLYLWLTEFPLRDGEGWAWWTLLVSGAAGFASFLTYIGYGYLDTWHGVATLALLPLFSYGMFRTFALIDSGRSISSLKTGIRKIDFKSREGFGWACIVFTGAGMIAAGATIMGIGMTNVFVPEDILFLQITRPEIAAINSHLIPLIAHDRAGFGGGLVATGILVALIALHAKPSMHLWEAIAIAGIAGFFCAIYIHFHIGYVILVHVAPACIGAAVFLLGLALIYPANKNAGAKYSLPSVQLPQEQNQR